MSVLCVMYASMNDSDSFVYVSLQDEGIDIDNIDGGDQEEPTCTLQ